MQIAQTLRKHFPAPAGNPIRALLAWLALCTAAMAAPFQSFDHRAGGYVFDAFALTDAQGVSHQWTVEDGGRIRYRENDDRWTFQDLPLPIQDQLRRIHFLPPSGGLFEGWAVGQNGAVAYTEDGGANWIAMSQIMDPNLGGAPADLYDIHMLPGVPGEQNGWLLSTKTLWHTSDSGANWNVATINSHFYNLSLIEYYSLDVVKIGNKFVGMACGEPGIVIYSEQLAPAVSDPPAPLLATWQGRFDIVNYCGIFAPTSCQVKNAICTPPMPGVQGKMYEPWGIKLLVDNVQGKELALMTGGVGSSCGLAFSSVDRGATWARDTHECDDPVFDCPNKPDLYFCGVHQSEPKRQCTMRTQYDIDGYPDGTAVSCGYNGQQLVRTDGYVSPGTWKDRSEFASPFTVPQAVVYPLVGVAAYLDGQSDRQSLITGSGGYLRQSEGTWDQWVNSYGAVNHPLLNPDRLPDDPWRLRAVHFRNSTVGWRVGQFARISRTSNSGFTWQEQDPDAAGGNPYLNAITVAPDGLHGVTVGDVTGAGDPLILYNEDADSNPNWRTDAVITGAGPRRLLDVAWAGNTGADHRFWAVGEAGLLLMSDDSGKNWDPDTLPSPYNSNPALLTELSGVAFEPASGQGVVVGRAHYPGTGGGGDPVLGVALYRDASGTWTDIRPTDPSLATTLTRITAVAIDAATSTVWAAGQKEDAGVVTGVILKGTLGTSALVLDGPTTPIARCETGKDVGELPVLTSIAVAPGGDVWAGGSCGRLWLGSSGGSSWSEQKSQTSSHIRKLSFVADGAGYTGFIGCHRDDDNTTQALIRVQQP